LVLPFSGHCIELSRTWFIWNHLLTHFQVTVFLLALLFAFENVVGEPTPSSFDPMHTFLKFLVFCFQNK
jgi:hypothetical protein